MVVYKFMYKVFGLNLISVDVCGIDSISCRDINLLSKKV